ncbi:hypothetical protein HQN86_12445 [Pedobacter panaciterrae]|uniref:hypothetical protein n=1 Tax=Pedobacter panaciterrae TaxID=363849 RepID=UPI00155DDC80|nr:hypothetical protein [Pedobacter panaciterrae]NQX54426.1 hypothetical protein [Pedobacter panaciterrae]
MIYKRFFVILICLIFSVVSVGALYFLSTNARENKNNFIRLLPSHKIVPDNVMALSEGRWYIAGLNYDSIYLANLYTPEKLLKVNVAVNDSSAYNLEFPEGSKLTKGYFSLVSDGSIYTLDGDQPLILYSSIQYPFLKPLVKPPYFTQAAYIARNSLVLRIVQNAENKLVKYQLDSAGFRVSPNLLHKQVDGIFSTDGNLIVEPKSARIFYVYYYRNQFICADTNLNLLYQGKTIDTNSTAKVKIVDIKSQNQTTLAAPPIEVNKRIAVNEGYLFIQSGLIADNEVVESLKEVSIIDVYTIKDGKYHFSFYLPDFNKKKLTDFKVYGQSLYALYDHYLYKYKLNF